VVTVAVLLVIVVLVLLLSLRGVCLVAVVSSARVLRCSFLRADIAIIVPTMRRVLSPTLSMVEIVVDGLFRRVLVSEGAFFAIALVFLTVVFTDG